MGIFDQYNDIQLKAGEPWQNYYKTGDEVKIPDGVYIDDEGAVVIADGKLLHTTNQIYNYWGDIISKEHLGDLQ